MDIKHFEVRNDFLKKYIDYYYMLSTINDVKDTTYIAFPSCNSPLGFFKNTSFLKLSDEFNLRSVANDSLEVLLVGNFLKPLKLTFEPNILEFAIVFKPLGINYFISENLGLILREAVSPINNFAGFAAVINKLINGVDAFDELETKLADKFTTNKQLKTLESIIDHFKDCENQLYEQQISAELNISVKKLFRLFKDHLGVNPTQFRHLLRFRTALQLSLKKCQEQNLTEVGMMAGYYDQPHFIKEFRKITNLAPRDFLSKISLEANDKIAWQFFPEMSDSYN